MGAPGSPAGAPPKSGKGPLFWGGIACCGCLFLMLLGLGAAIGIPMMVSQGAVTQVKAQLQDIKSGNLDAAVQRFSASAGMTKEQLQELIDQHPAMKSNADTTFNSRSVKNNTATLSGTLTGTGGEREEVTYTLVKEAGGWKITGLQFGSGPVSSNQPRTPTQNPGRPTPDGGAASGLQIQTVSSDKEPDGENMVVKIKIAVTGFGVGGDGKVDLVQDLETHGPDGQKMDSLSRLALQRLNEHATAPTFEDTLTFRNFTPGSYRARLTVRDQVAQNIESVDVPFELP